MKYVYILKSLSKSGRHYTGVADDVEERLKQHNAGEVKSSAPYKPWVINSFTAFSEHEKAFNFERYLKSGSGRAFTKKHF